MISFGSLLVLSFSVLSMLVTAAYADDAGALKFREPWPWKFDNGKVTMQKLTVAERKEAQKALASVTDTNIDSGLRGGFLFDCKIVRTLPTDANGQPAWLVMPTRVYLGSKSISTRQLKVISPSAENNGVLLAVGKRYRLFAVDIQQMEDRMNHRRISKQGDLYTWNALQLK